MTGTRGRKRTDWTATQGHTNSSEAFLAIVADVARMLRHHRMGDDPVMTAHGIVARLAHVHGLAPRRGEKKS